MNKQVVFNSILALIFVALTFFVDWLFLIGAVVIMIINQKLLFDKNKK